MSWSPVDGWPWYSPSTARTRPTARYYLVTDLGLRYAVPTDAALTALGYQPTDAVKVLSSLVLRIPAGPALDPAAAVKAAAGTAGG